MIVSPAFAGQRFAVLGLARSGLAAVESLLASGASVMAWDSRDEARQAAQALDHPALDLTDPLTADLAGFTGVVVSPGVPLNRHPIADHARAAGVPVIGDIELFARARPALPRHKVIGITGTNGKSTTTALALHLLLQAGRSALMGGNIGLPILSHDPLEPNAAGDAVYVLELSSYQIDLTQRIDCEVAVLLNLSPDHLDRYDGFEGYAASKARLFGMQALGHLAVIDFHAATDHAMLRDAPEDQLVQFIAGVDLPGDQADWPSLQGPHNRSNAAAAVAAVRAMGVDEAAIAAGLKSFRGLPHRMERVAEHGGVAFINDSKATNPASTAPALAAFPRIHWILGGLPKGEDLDDCLPHLNHVVAAYTIGEAGPRFAELLECRVPVRRSEMLSGAVREAMAAAQPGDVVMLSPACASFDQFRDFEARGEAFTQIVQALIAEQEDDGA